MTSSPSASAGVPPFDPREFFELAKTLASNSSEAELRTAVGRAYYAMYLIASARPSVQTQKKNVPRTKGMGMHEHLLTTLKSMSGHTTTAHKLRQLKELRTQADYHLSPALYYQNWRQNWNTAEQLVKDLLPVLSQL